MSYKFIESLRGKIKEKIDKASDTDEIAALESELADLDEIDKEHEKTLKGYRSLLKQAKGRTDDDEADGDDDDDDRSDETGEGKKALSFEEAYAKVVAKRPKN